MLCCFMTFFLLLNIVASEDAYDSTVLNLLSGGGFAGVAHHRWQNCL